VRWSILGIYDAQEGFAKLSDVMVGGGGSEHGHRAGCLQGRASGSPPAPGGGLAESAAPRCRRSRRSSAWQRRASAAASSRSSRTSWGCRTKTSSTSSRWGPQDGGGLQGPARGWQGPASCAACPRAAPRRLPAGTQRARSGRTPPGTGAGRPPPRPRRSPATPRPAARAAPAGAQPDRQERHRGAQPADQGQHADAAHLPAAPAPLRARRAVGAWRRAAGGHYAGGARDGRDGGRWRRRGGLHDAHDQGGGGGRWGGGGSGRAAAALRCVACGAHSAAPPLATAGRPSPLAWRSRPAPSRTPHPPQACDLIRASNRSVVMEAELKIALGLRQTKGHRTWRR
jgi:hypothetical protein